MDYLILNVPNISLQNNFDLICHIQLYVYTGRSEIKIWLLLLDWDLVLKNE